MSQTFQWFPLTQITGEKQESDLQSIFDEWHLKSNQYAFAGTPDWLSDCKEPNSRSRTKGYGSYSSYDFTPDVFWKKRQIIGELKRSEKYEPLALAEVLHHAWQLRDSSGTYPTPFIVGSGTGGEWTRGALRFLFDHGLQRDAMHYIEITFWRLENGEDAELVWFDEPFATLCGSEPPVCVPDSWKQKGQLWLKCDNSDTWVSVESESHWQDAVIPKKYIYVSRVENDREAYLVATWNSNTDLAEGQESYHLVQAKNSTGTDTTRHPSNPFETV